EHLASLGAALGWHGALMLDYLYDPVARRPAYIDANPRIGETLNATLSGVNLCQVLVGVALDQPVTPLPPGREGVQTHSVVLSMLAAGVQGKGRRDILADLARAWRGEGVYADSQDELTRPREDPLSLVPALVVLGRVLVD